MPGMMYIPPNRRENPMANMGMNFLMQLAMSKIAHDRRMEEKKLEIDQQKIAIAEDRAYKQKERERPKTATPLMLNGQPIGFLDEDGRISFTPSEKKQEDKFQDFDIGDEKVKGQYTGNPQDTIKGSGVVGWKEVSRADRYRPAQTNVKMELPIGETAATKKLGEQVGEAAGKRLTMAQEARTQNVQLDQFKLALSQGASTGFGEETLMGIKSIAQTVGQSMGFEIGDIAPQESIRRISNEMALRLRNPESGLGLTGNTSNQDLNFLKESVPGLNRTERGNLLMIDAMQRTNELKVAVAKEQSKIIRENKGVVPNDMDERLMDFVDKYPIFKPHERAAIKKMSQKIINTGTHKDGRKTVQFEDGTWEYAN